MPQCRRPQNKYSVRENLVSKGQKLKILHTDRKHGFVAGAYLHSKCNLTTGDYHSTINHEQTEKQVKETLIPNLSKRRVISISQHTSYSILNIKFMVYLTILSVAQTTEC
jgi:hypothetical protein